MRSLVIAPTVAAVSDLYSTFSPKVPGELSRNPFHSSKSSAKRESLSIQCPVRVHGIDEVHVTGILSQTWELVEYWPGSRSYLAVLRLHEARTAT